MSGEGFPMGGLNVADQNMEDDAFTRIVQEGLDSSYLESLAPGDVVPFGQFTETLGDEHDARKAPMASATGYTGNNSEEAS